MGQWQREEHSNSKFEREEREEGEELREEGFEDGLMVSLLLLLVVVLLLLLLVVIRWARQKQGQEASWQQEGIRSPFFT